MRISTTSKVLFVLPSSKLGGAEKVLYTLANLLNQKCKIHILILDDKLSSEWDFLKGNSRLHFSKKILGSSILGGIKTINKLSKSIGNFDMVISSATKVNGLLGILRKSNILSTTTLIARESTQIMDRFTGFKRFIFSQLYRWGYGIQDLIIYQTNYMKERLELSIPYASKWNTKVISNPIEINEILVKSLYSCETPTSKEYVLGVGRLINLKGFDLLIKSLKYLPLELDLVIMGDGEERENLEALVRCNQLEKRVHFIGYQSNPYPYMKNARICVVSSRVEGFPNTLLQMMTLNDRVVSTLCAGDIDKILGISTSKINDIKSLTNSIKISLDLSPDELKLNRVHFDKELASRTPNKFLASILNV